MTQAGYKNIIHDPATAKGWLGGGGVWNFFVGVSRNETCEYSAHQPDGEWHSPPLIANACLAFIASNVRTAIISLFSGGGGWCRGVEIYGQGFG